MESNQSEPSLPEKRVIISFCFKTVINKISLRFSFAEFTPEEAKLMFI